MNAWHGLNPLSLLPPLALQQLFHAVIWLAVLSWLGVQCLPSYDRRWRWVMCSAAALLVLLVWQSVLPALGMVFQTPSLMTLCACLAVAWSDIKGPSVRLFGNHTDTRLSPWLWFAVVLVGWCLLLDAFGMLPWDIYSLGFDHQLLWLAWWLSGLWITPSPICCPCPIGMPEPRPAGCWLPVCLWQHMHPPAMCGTLGWTRACGCLRITSGSHTVGFSAPAATTLDATAIRWVATYCLCAPARFLNVAQCPSVLPRVRKHIGLHRPKADRSSGEER